MSGIDLDIVRLLLPPAGSISVIQLQNSLQATKALKSLSYLKLGKSIVYARSLSDDIWELEETSDDLNSVVHQSVCSKSIEADHSGKIALFVKNINFASTTQEVEAVFCDLPGYISLSLANSKQVPEGRHSGYGWVAFTDWPSADNAMRLKDGHVLDGYALVCKQSERKIRPTNDDDSIASGANSTKIVIKNLPFEANKTDLSKLLA